MFVWETGKRSWELGRNLLNLGYRTDDYFSICLNMWSLLLSVNFAHLIKSVILNSLAWLVQVARISCGKPTVIGKNLTLVGREYNLYDVVFCPTVMRIIDNENRNALSHLTFTVGLLMFLFSQAAFLSLIFFFSSDISAFCSCRNCFFIANQSDLK